MPHSSDDQPDAPRPSAESETPSATAGEAPDGANPTGPSSADGEPYQQRRHRRRRRRRPPSAAVSQAAAIADETTPKEAPPAGGAVHDTQVPARGDAGESPASRPRRHRRRRRGPPRDASQQSPVRGDSPVGEDAQPDPTTVAPSEDATPAQPAPGAAGETPRPRRRRRRPARRPGLMDPADSGGQGSIGSEAITEGTSQSEPGAVGRPWPSRPRNRRLPDQAAPEGDPHPRGPRQPREQTEGPRDAGARAPDRRDQGADARGRRDRRASGRPPGRGRDAPPRKPEQKLYALESVVDRGFEDVTEDSDEGGTRRVHWTII